MSNITTTITTSTAIIPDLLIGMVIAVILLAIIWLIRRYNKKERNN